MGIVNDYRDLVLFGLFLAARKGKERMRLEFADDFKGVVVHPQRRILNRLNR